MKASLNWLREFVDLPESAGEIARRLRSLGFGVESIEHVGAAFEGVVTAEVLAVRAHPNADKLRLCDVSDGTQTYGVVCGAPNVAQGQKVCLARLGAKLPGGVVIKAAKIRGEASSGMLCSGKELGAASDAQGILVLPPDTKLGLDAAELFGGRDTVLDIEITPNRPDLLSHLGLARELAWSLNAQLRRPFAAELDLPGSALPVTIEDGEACPHYTGLIFEGVQVGPSPAWLARRLEACGLRPINNLVDITNYILLEQGQPLHAFDAAKIEGGEIRVRRARPGEKLAALDGREQVLEPSDLVVADTKKALALAGVIGGAESSVQGSTTRVFLECARFKPAVVRRSARRLRLKTDSSYRFERGTDQRGLAPALARAARLIEELCGAKPSGLTERGGPGAPREIEVSMAGLRDSFGMPLQESEVETVLRGLDPALRARDGGWTVASPSWRVDLAIEDDIAEEVARMVGYDRLPAAAAPVPLSLHEELPSRAWLAALSDRALGLGLSEAYNYDFLSEKDLQRTSLAADGPKLANPTSTDWVYLRPSLLPGLLRNLRHNLFHGAEGARFFETGKVYRPGGESLVLAGLLGGHEGAHWTRPAPTLDFPSLKGLVEALLDGLASFRTEADSASAVLHPKRALSLFVGKTRIGRLGQVHPQILKAWELPDGWYFELELEALGAAPAWTRAFHPYSVFPSSSRDLSVVLPEDAAWAQVEAAVRRAAGARLSNLSLIDVFSGGQIPQGSRSLTLRMALASADKTLAEGEIQETVGAVLKALEPLGARLRS